MFVIGNTGLAYLKKKLTKTPKRVSDLNFFYNSGFKFLLSTKFLFKLKL